MKISKIVTSDLISQMKRKSKKKNRKLIYIVRNIDRMVLTRMRSMGWILQGRF